MSGKIERQSADEDKHTGDATCLVYHNGQVFSGGADGRIKIWNTDLQLINEIADAHESYIYAMAICRQSGRLYSSSADGTIRYFDLPLQQPAANATASPNAGTILMRTQYDEIGALFCDTADATVMWSGDDKGAVIKWVDGRIAFKYNLVEEVRCLWVENTLLYTARDLDVVMTEVGNSRTGQYITTATLPGRAPLALIGSRVSCRRQSRCGLRDASDSDQDAAAVAAAAMEFRRQYLVFSTRDGRGVQLVRNSGRYETIWTRSDAHEMIINALCGNETELFTAGYDGHVRKWTELMGAASTDGEGAQPLLAGDAIVGHCVNAMCVGENGAVYVADTRGVVSRVGFSGKAA